MTSSTQIAPMILLGFYVEDAILAFRGLKRILGETSLERKCRWMLGIFTLTLMAGSFYFYAQKTENIAYDQLTHTGRTLVSPIVAKLHVKHDPELTKGMDEFQRMAEKNWPLELKNYKYQLILSNPTRPELEPNPADLSLIKYFVDHPDQFEQSRELKSENSFVYYGAIRAADSCVQCHQSQEKLESLLLGVEDGPERAAKLADPTLQKGDLMGVVSVKLSTEMIQAGFYQNRALLVAFAFVTTTLILLASYIIIRFVVVRPVKHLKSVSDAIATGQMNVRSEIQTGDEFEDLSVAFNRMISNLINIQERNRGLISDLDRKVDQLARVNIELFQSNKLKAEFLSTMSHELRTPLNSIIGFSEVLLSGSNMNEKQLRYLDNIHASGKQLLLLINDVLDLAKMESGKLLPRPEIIPVKQLLQSVVAMFRPQVEEKNLEIIVDCEPHVEIQQDASKLQQILNNLISNAVKFTPDSGRITIRAERDEQFFHLYVSDTGIGIAPEEQALIFQKFRQASHPLTREQGGTGLGLSIVRELARLLGGEVFLQSDLGRGSTFHIKVLASLELTPPQQTLDPFLDETLA